MLVFYSVLLRLPKPLQRTATGLELSRTEQENGSTRNAENRVNKRYLPTGQNGIGAVVAHS